jgi:hypothetical protein
MNLWYMDTWDKREHSLEGVRIRYYFDDESEPRIDMDVSIFFSEENPLGVFIKPFAWNGEDYFRVLYLPMYFQRRLKVTMSREPGGTDTREMLWMGHYSEIPDSRVHWYQYTYHTFTEDPGIPSGIDTTGMKQITSAWEVPGHDPKPPSPNNRVHGIIGIGPGEMKDIFTKGTQARGRFHILPPAQTESHQRGNPFQHLAEDLFRWLGKPAGRCSPGDVFWSLPH